MEVRTIITEALSRANIVPRRQPAPGDLLLSAYKLLQGVASKLNNDNFLAFTQSGLDLPARQVIHIYGNEDTMLDEGNYVFETIEQLNDSVPETTEDWAMVKTMPSIVYKANENLEWVPFTGVDDLDPRVQNMRRYLGAHHVHLDGVAKLNTLCINRNQPYGMLKLSFVPREEFDAYSSSDLLWTFKELSQGEWIIEVKPYIATQSIKLRLQYNRALEFDIDSDLRVPDAYVELLTVALTYKLAVAYPRMDDSQLARLRAEYDEMLNNVKAPKADAKQVLRDDHYDDRSSYWGVIGGRMWG